MHSDRIEYRVRPTLFRGLTSYVLDGDSLEVSEQPRKDGAKQAGSAPGPQRIPLSAIVRLRLVYAASRYQRNRYECLLLAKAPASSRKQAIVSLHFRGLADFVDQADTYTPFVRALCLRAAAANPSVQILAGYSPFFYYLGLLLAFVVSAGFGTFVFYHWDELLRMPHTPSDLVLAACLMVSLLMVYYRNRPRRLQADSLPDDLLPKQPSSGAS